MQQLCSGHLYRSDQCIFWCFLKVDVQETITEKCMHFFSYLYSYNKNIGKLPIFELKVRPCHGLDLLPKSSFLCHLSISMKPSMLLSFNENCDYITETLFKERFHLSTESLPDKSKEEVLFFTLIYVLANNM